MTIHVPKEAIVDLLESPLAASLSAEQTTALKSLTGHFSPAIVVLPEYTSAELLELLLPSCEKLGHRAHVSAIKTVLAAARNPQAAIKIAQLNACPQLVYQWMRKNFINGFVYKILADGRYNPFLLTSAKYIPPQEREKIPASVEIDFVANRAHGRESFTIHLERSDIAGQTVDSLMARHGLMHETPELMAEFDAHSKRCEELITNIGQQYRLRGAGLSTDYGSRAHDFKKYGAAGSIAVNAFDQLKSAMERNTGRDRTRELHEVVYLRDLYKDGTPVPRHPYICTFSLSEHTFHYVHVANVEVYQYDTELVKQLVLPPEHHDLIEALLETTTDKNADFIENKNAGTIIICLGPPGCGKTLTAETAVQFIKKPLYRVHSGQLGSTPEQIEKNLKIILDRAVAWNSVVLVDEADCFLRERGEDMAHNAVVATFLRQLEYFTGTIFLTSNRTESIDDAFLSRATAIIRYKLPAEPQLRRLWRNTATRMKAHLSDDQIEELVKQFPKLSGRDLTLLFSLVDRYAKRRKKTISPEVFRYCAQFRGLV